MAFRNFIPPREESFMQVHELVETPKITKNGIDVEIFPSNEIADLPDYRCYNADVLESAGVPLSRVSCALLTPDSDDVLSLVEAQSEPETKS